MSQAKESVTCIFIPAECHVFSFLCKCMYIDGKKRKEMKKNDSVSLFFFFVVCVCVCASDISP